MEDGGTAEDNYEEYLKLHIGGVNRRKRVPPTKGADEDESEGDSEDIFNAGAFAG